jgi:hypothetical protein
MRAVLVPVMFVVDVGVGVHRSHMGVRMRVLLGHVGRADSGRHETTFPHEYRAKPLLSGPSGTTYGDKGEQPQTAGSVPPNSHRGNR